VGKRILIYLGGPLMNIISGWILAVLLFLTGIPGMHVVVDEVAPASPAAAANMQVGDIVLAVDGETIEAGSDLQIYAQQHLETPIELLLKRDEQTLTVSVTPRANPPEGQGSIGIMISGIEKPGSLKQYPLGQALGYGTRYYGTMAGMTIILPILTIRGLIPLEQARPVGVIGISQIAQRSVEDSITAGAPYPFMNILILLSISLGIFNLLPIPALDGGRILFSIIEKIRRKPLTPEIGERIHVIAFMLMLALFIFITALDIISPVPLP
jgi:regulator of sigma E protease